MLLALFADLEALATIDRDLPRYGLVGGASIYPFAWNLLLAARAEGLGGVITTIATRREEEVKALLGAPDEMALAAVIVLGHPVRQPRRLTRAPVADWAVVDRFDGAPFGSDRVAGQRSWPTSRSTYQNSSITDGEELHRGADVGLGRVAPDDRLGRVEDRPTREGDHRHREPDAEREAEDDRGQDQHERADAAPQQQRPEERQVAPGHERHRREPREPGGRDQRGRDDRRCRRSAAPRRSSGGTGRR